VTLRNPLRPSPKVREYFAESLTRHTTLCEMLVLLAHAPPLVSEAGDEEEEAKPEAGASAAWTDLLERAQSVRSVPPPPTPPPATRRRPSPTALAIQPPHDSRCPWDSHGPRDSMGCSG
jgi:hypothetical protein